MFSRSCRSLLVLAVLASFGVAGIAEAQLGSLGNLAKRSITDEIGRKIDALLRDGVRCVFEDLECIRQAEAQESLRS